MSLSAKELAAMDRTRRNVKKQTYQALLEQFTRKIRTSYELGRREAILTVPPFVVGFPKYDLARAVVYMARQLTKLGYVVQLVGPLDIRVRWSREEGPGESVPDDEGDTDVLPGLVNLQKVARQIRSKKH